MATRSHESLMEHALAVVDRQRRAPKGTEFIHQTADKNRHKVERRILRRYPGSELIFVPGHVFFAKGEGGLVHRQWGWTVYRRVPLIDAVYNRLGQTPPLPPQNNAPAPNAPAPNAPATPEPEPVSPQQEVAMTATNATPAPTTANNGTHPKPLPIPAPRRAKTPKVLGTAEVIKLSNWLGANYEALANEGLSLERLATRASESLGFEITPANMQNVFDASGLPRWTTKKVRSPLAGGRGHARRMKMMAAAIQHLYAQLGVQIPAEYREAFEDLA